MKCLLILGIIAVIYTPVLFAGHSNEDSSSSSSSSSESSEKIHKIKGTTTKVIIPNKVKITNSKIVHLDDEYVDKKTFKLEVAKVNKTYNRLDADYVIKKDIPDNTTYTVEVLRSDSKNGDYKQIHYYVIECFCKNNKNKYFEYLPGLLVNLNNEGKCYPKGRYQNCNATYFRFYDLMSKEELNNGYFKMISKIILGQKVLYGLQLEFESNYRKY